jgi:glycogen phosphorylase
MTDVVQSPDTARSGKFSSDRAIAEYCDEIWHVGPVTVKV